MEDVVETLLGTEIVDEKDENVDMQAVARQRWKNRFKQIELTKRASQLKKENPPQKG
jgi:CBS domain containing-hemolysin-like protein